MSDYSFIKEVIKKKPINKKMLLFKFCCLLVGAVLFGGVAAFTFANMLPIAQESVEAKKAPANVDIPADEEELQVKETDSGETKDPEITPEVVEVPAQLGLADYRMLYQDMKKVSESADKSIVTVIGITNEVDYFSNTYENPGQLSGIIVANNGKELLVLTEYRVVEGVDRIQVTFCNETMVEARYQKQDPNTGLTILKVSLEDIDQETKDAIVMAPFGNSYSLTQGEPVIALGSPMGYSDSIAFGVVTSVTNKVSTLDTEYSLVTTDILGSKEGSGILVDLDGKIVGMIVQSYSTENNTVTALSISQIKQLIETLSNNKAIPYVGIKGQEVTADIAEKTGKPRGIFIDEVQPDSPAMLAEMMNGDVIVKIADQEINSLAEYRKELEKCTIGQPVKITTMREGVEGYAEIVFDVTVGAL